MNYVKLKLGDKERGAKVGIGFLKYFTEEKQMTLNEVFESFNSGANSLLFLGNMIYHALLYNCKRAGETAKFEEADVLEWIDDAGGINGEESTKFINAFTESLGTDLGKEKPETPAKK